MTQKSTWNEESNWKGKVAIVTGGSSGIGEAIAVALAESGTRVMITGRTAKRLDEVALAHENIEACQVDSADPDSGARIVEATTKRWEQLDLIVNNAGAGQPLPMEAYDAQVIAKMTAVNITAPSMLVREARSALVQSKGAVVNIGSATSRGASAPVAHYAASKAALEHLTRSWAIELAAHGVRVNAIAPGPVKSGALTGMMGLPEEVARQIEEQEAAQIPLGRRGLPGDIAPWVLHLGSSANAWLTGQVITIDGGWSLRS